MAVTSKLFRLNPSSLLAAKENWSSDAIKMALVTAQSFNFDSDQYFDVATAHYTEVAAGNGYTTGGVALTSLSVTYTAANSWSATAATSTAYSIGQVVKPSGGNGYLYQCVAAGTSGGSAPTWGTTIGALTTDNTVTWLNVGEGITVITSAAGSWSSATISAIGAVIYDSTPASNKPLAVYIDFGGTLASTNSTYTVTPDPTYGWQYMLDQ